MEADETRIQDEPPVELEDQFILRLPLPQAEAVRKALKNMKSKKFAKFLSISLDRDKKEIRRGTVRIKNKTLHAKLVDLPCIVESCKTTDKVHLFKTADVCQMLVCQKESFEESEAPAKLEKFSCPHGVAPPMKNVKRTRFRKVLQNKEPEETAEIKKEVLWLLRADNEAVSTRFEIHYEEAMQAVNENTIFGGAITDSDSSDSAPSSTKTSTTDLTDVGRTSLE